jgi:hypothetical protein
MELNKTDKSKFFEFFFTIPALTIFIYSFTVLVQVGENSYFNIPGSFVDTSVGSIVIYGDFLIKSIATIAFAGWLVAGMIIALLITSFFLFGPRGWYKAIAVSLMVVFLYLAPKLGTLIAENETRFYVPGDDCQNMPKGTSIAVDFYNEKIVFLSIDQGTSSATTTNEFFVKDVTSLNCKMKWKRTGKIEKQ